MTTKNDTLDPRHRPQFQPGFVLGARDLQQEWTWLDGRDRWLAREAIGYGTLRGLAVSVHDGDGGAHEIRVGPGVALDPAGRLICVAETQCATLEGWLAQERAGGGEASDSIYVVLRYEAVACEGVPVRGDACCSDAAAPVRLRDGFQLALTHERPRHLEHRALRAWRRLIAGVRVVAEGEALPPVAWEAQIRRAFAAILTPGEVEPLIVSADQSQSFLRLAERLFVTELWPETTEDAGGSGARGLELTEADAGVLLATLRIRTGELGGVAVEEDDRPILAPAAAILGGGSASVAGADDGVSETEEESTSEETDGEGSTGVVSVGVKAILGDWLNESLDELSLLQRRIEALEAEVETLRAATGATSSEESGAGGSTPEDGTLEQRFGYYLLQQRWSEILDWKSIYKDRLRVEIQGDEPLTSTVANKVLARIPAGSGTPTPQALDEAAMTTLKAAAIEGTRDYVTTQLRASLASDLRSLLVADLRANVATDLRASLASDLRTTLAAELRAQVRADVRDSLLAELKADLLPQLRNQVSSELGASLAADLRASVESQVHTGIRTFFTTDSTDRTTLISTMNTLLSSTPTTSTTRILGG